MTATYDPGQDREYVPSPSRRVREQVSSYEASGGDEGGTLLRLPKPRPRSAGMQARRST